MPYLTLLLAVVAETVGTTALQASQQFTRLWPSVLVVVAYGISFYLLALTLRLVDEEVLSLNAALARLTCEPAAILGLTDCGNLGEGGRADICIYDPDQPWRVDPTKFLSTGKNTPFSGWELKGKVTHTLLAGQQVYCADDN